LILSFLFRVDCLVSFFIAFGLYLLLVLYLSLPLLSFPGFFNFFGLDYDVIQGQWLNLSIIDEGVRGVAVTSEGSHAGNDDKEHPSIAEVRSHLLDLDFIELADTLVQALLDIPLQDLLSRSVLFNELRRVFRTVKC
jgi:hypothetical protein